MLITIGIPTYRRLEYLKQATQSALAQTYSSIEVLISDDGTSDEIAVWGKEMQREFYPKVRYQRNVHNLGLAGNWNRIADQARGDYLIIIGDDDRLEPKFVETLISALETGAAVAFCNQHVIDEKGSHIPGRGEFYTRHYYRSFLSSGKIENPASVVWRNSIPMSASLVRTELIRRLRFKEDLNNPEIELFARLTQEPNHDFYFFPAYLAEYREHSQSETSSGLRNELLAAYMIRISVSADIEPLKRTYLAPIVVTGVGRALRQKNRKLAKELFNSIYYPEREKKSIRGLIYRLALILPKTISNDFYASMVWLRRNITSHIYFLRKWFNEVSKQ